MAGYRPTSFLALFAKYWPRRKVHKHAQRRTRPISCHLDRTNYGIKNTKKYLEGNFCWGKQRILPARGPSGPDAAAKLKPENKSGRNGMRTYEPVKCSTNWAVQPTERCIRCEFVKYIPVESSEYAWVYKDHSPGYDRRHARLIMAVIQFHSSSPGVILRTHDVTSSGSVGLIAQLAVMGSNPVRPEFFFSR